MSLLKEAEIDQCAAKVGVFGLNGTGKSFTAMMLAIGLSKTFHNGAPIAEHDTEGASDFLVPILKMEGIRFLRHKSTSFKDMVTMLQEAEEAGACVYLQDQASRPWDELQTTYKRKKNRQRLEFQDWAELKQVWREQFVDRYLASPLHCIVLGRAGNEYDTVEDQETGKRSQERVGSKFKAEGEFGYEPNLLIEMEGRRTPLEEVVGRKRRVRKQGGRIVHYAHVIKDRGRALNGVSFEFAGINKYKVGDWKRVFDAFSPHWEFLNIGNAEHKGIDVTSNSGDLIAGNGQPGELRRGTQVQIALDEINETIAYVFPRADQASKRIRQAILHEVFGTFSWTAIEHKSLETLETAANLLRAFKVWAEAPESQIATEDQVVKLLRLCRDRQATEVATAAEAEQPVTDDEGRLVF